MTKIDPNDLSGARTYFTGFDTKSYVTKDKKAQQKILERTLKVLLLTKNKIVFGASHLKNDLAHTDIKDITSFKMYQNLIYNVSGARVVNCESSLDIHKNNSIFNISFIDALEFSDVMNLREKIYDTNFKSDIEKEASIYLKRQQRDRNDKTIQAIFEPAFNILKSMYVPSNLILDNKEHLTHLFRNVYNKFTTREEQNSYLDFINHQDKVVKDLIKSTQIDNASSLVGVSSMLKNYIYEKYERF
jgi:hypothetical protein